MTWPTVWHNILNPRISWWIPLALIGLFCIWAFILWLIALNAWNPAEGPTLDKDGSLMDSTLGMLSVLFSLLLIFCLIIITSLNIFQ